MKVIKSSVFSFFALFAVFVFSSCSLFVPDAPKQKPDNDQTQIGQVDINSKKIDDWQYKSENRFREKYVMKTMVANDSMALAPSNLGLSVGGAKDVNNFRENINNGFLPIPTDITYEGLFNDYYFDTGVKKECDKLFCPSYNIAVSNDPLSKKPEYYLSVGLNSGIKENDFQRKKLNIVVVMDISGSMGGSFNSYYYDRFGNRIDAEIDSKRLTKSKMSIANQSLVALLDKLHDDDRFGIVLFDDQAYMAKPLSMVKDTDMQKIKDHIMEILERGGTNMEAGMKEGTSMLQEFVNSDSDQYENRIVFITDAMLNYGNTSKLDFLETLRENAKNHIYTTMIGVGVDFNTELVEAISKIRGANYYSVHSEKEFKKVLDEDFDFMVTPLVFDLKLQLESDGFEIEKVYGSPEADEATGEIMKVNTLFPSRTEDGKVRGGVVILKLNPISSNKQITNNSLKLKVTYEDRNGKKDFSEAQVDFGDKKADFYENLGVRKAILLVRYVNLIKGWLIDENRLKQRPSQELTCPPIIAYETGIRCPDMRCILPMPPRCDFSLREWERQSNRLEVSEHYRGIMSDFMNYFRSEMAKISDDSLKKEIEILEKLSK